MTPEIETAVYAGSEDPFDFEGLLLLSTTV